MLFSHYSLESVDFSMTNTKNCEKITNKTAGQIMNYYSKDFIDRTKQTEMT